MKSGFTLLFLLFSYIAFSQDSSFSLKDYKYRTPGFKALALSLNFSSESGKYKRGTVYETGSNQLLLGPTAVTYTKISSTDTRLHESTISLTPSFHRFSNSIDGKKAVYNSFHPNFSWNRNDRFYRDKQWFFEVGNKLSADYSSSLSKDTSINHKNSGTTLSDQLTLGIGKGRIERVQDAQMALYLLHDLSAEGLLSRPYTAEEATQLARVITNINNQRVFDLRRRRKYELTRLDSFFRSSGLAPQTDIRHFTVLNDNWALALNPSRLSGANWYIRLQPEVYNSRATEISRYSGSKYTQKAFVTTLRLSPVIGYEAYRPANLQWQFNKGVSLAYANIRYKQKNEVAYPGNIIKTSSDTTGGQVIAHGFYGVGYYPNNRTQINATIDLTGYFQGNSAVNIVSAFDLNLQYFIGYRTFLSADAQASHSLWKTKVNGKNETTYLFFTNFAVSLSHVLF